MCNDPTRQVITVLFTNRCYPNQTKGLDTIRYVRQNFNNAVGICSPLPFCTTCSSLRPAS